jgi:hypothetical protein
MTEATDTQPLTEDDVRRIVREELDAVCADLPEPSAQMLALMSEGESA